MARRIFEIAKELGVESKAIVTKCHAEGIPESTIKNHMSTVSAGLEATIREWFTVHDAGDSTTAVETSDKVDLDQVRTRTSRKKAKTISTDEPDDADTGSSVAAVVEEPPPAVKARPAKAKAVPVSPAVEPEPAPEADEAIVQPEAPVAPPAPAPKVLTPAAKAPAALDDSKSDDEGETKPIAKPAADRPHMPAKLGPAKTITAAPPNVPTRPTVVSPAGPRLQTVAPVKLSGPKVVRVEAPEQVQAPRSRGPRPAGPGGPIGPSRGPRVGGGAGEAGGGDDDRGRSPRRGGGGGGGGSSTASPKRSSGTNVPSRRRASSGEEWVGGQVFSEQDMIEREARLLRAGGFLKKRRQDMRRPDGTLVREGPADGKIRIPGPFTIKELSEKTGVKGSEIVKRLFMQGIMKKINDPIEAEKAVEIMMDLNIDLEVVAAKTAEEVVSSEFEERQAIDERNRGPVVTILGHVDHGKTSLLDKIRNANVAAGEAGGITQRTSAFKVQIEVAGETKNIVFLDTPGHEAFTSMRARGARVTDIAVLVVSAPEGVMPQTIESINHAKAAEVPIVVALNKIDRPDATDAMIQKTLGQLAEHGLTSADWGGTTEIIRTSATTGQGIKELLEALDFQAQLLDLKADFGGPARGSVVEARTEEGRGSVASLLVQDGKLCVGDFVVAGRAYGRVRDITDDRGTRLKEALPPMPVQVSGLDEVADAGDRFYVVDSLKKAQEAAEQRRVRERQTQLAQPKVTLDNIFSQMTDKSVKEILVVLKAAEQGTVEILKSQCEKVSGDEVKVRVLHGAVGGITESDVLLADASRAVIIGFNVIPSGKSRQLAESKGIEIRTYQVIYDITDDLKKAAEGMLTPELREEILGHAEVRAVFKVSKVGMIAGCYVTDGVVQRDASIRVTREGVVVEHDRKLAQLKRVKDDAKEVRAGMECGMKIDGYDDIKEGDVLECYKKIEVKRTL